MGILFKSQDCCGSGRIVVCKDNESKIGDNPPNPADIAPNPVEIAGWLI